MRNEPHRSRKRSRERCGSLPLTASYELQVEMIDRFGLLPPPARNLFDTTRLRLRAQAIGIKKLEAHAKGGRILFNDKPNIDPVRLIQMIQTKPQQFKLDGPDKLRFFAKLEEPEKRAEYLERVLGELVGR
ncbi:MAG: hypothetical protein KJ558_05840 [Gammaproteobacteria bacterium]|nr:hypothetical protein [Gammaproteobacteria bacterium]MBU1654338.1 hypothetical protein [Gammaproteobacteria bacterium]MBU1962656.1 hypothetical protein [Gammaproteobacteria bacterium]